MRNSGEAGVAGSENKFILVMKKIGNVLSTIGNWIMRLRKIILAIPVVYLAVSLALNNLKQLPEQVGITMLASGQYGIVVERQMAVWGPLGVTAACLLLMFCSRKTLYPWVISLFTLILPVFLLFMNSYPA